MRTLLFVAAAMLVLAGCQTFIRESLPNICRNAEKAHTAFEILAATGKVSQSTQDREAAAYANLKPLCVDPGSQTPADVLLAAVRAYANMKSALKDAQRVQ